MTCVREWRSSVRRQASKNGRRVTHEIPRNGDALLNGRRATGVVDAVVDLTRDPGEGLASGRGEVVAEAEEVGEEERSEEAVSHSCEEGAWMGVGRDGEREKESDVRADRSASNSDQGEGRQRTSSGR